jgi:hypothetical protein
MTRGTTPIHNFILPDNLPTSEVYSIQVIYTQINIDSTKKITLIKDWSCNGNDEARPTFDWNKEDSNRIIFDGHEVRVGLTTDETNKFDPKHFLKIQLTAIAKIRTSIPSEDASGNYAETISPGGIYKSDVVYLAVLEDLSNPYQDNSAKD